MLQLIVIIGLIDHAYLEDLLGGHHTVATDIRITKPSNQILINQIDNFGMLCNERPNHIQFFCVFVVN